MNDLPDDRIKELARQKREGRSYSEIRTRLSEEGLTDEEINRTIRRVDERVLEEETSGEIHVHARRWYFTGVAIAAVGLVITFLYSRGYIMPDLPRLLIYLPFFIGIMIMFYGRRLQRRSQH